MKCPTKQQDGRWQDKRHKSADERCKTHKDWKKAQDRPQFSNTTDKCLNCAGNHRMCDRPTRQQPHAFPASNTANGTGIYKNNSQFQNHSPQQHSQQSASMVGISTPTLMVNNQLQMGPQQGQQQHPSPQIPPVSQQANSPIRHNQFNQRFQQPLMPQVSPLMAPPQQYNPQIPPPYFHQYPPVNSPSVDSNESLLARVFHRQMDMAERWEKCDQEREEREKHKEEWEKWEKKEANQRACINKAFEKVECFDGSNPNRCLPWLEQIHAMSNNYNRDYHEELQLNSGGSITKTIHNIDVNTTAEQIKDSILHNHSNLKTPSQRLHAFNSIQQQPDEALQTYNSQYESHFWLAYPDITVGDTGSRTQCIRYANSLHSKLGDEMEGRFNQDLPESLQAAFKKATNFEPRILTKQTINTRRMNEVNPIDVTQCDDEFEVNKAHIQNPNYKN